MVFMLQRLADPVCDLGSGFVCLRRYNSPFSHIKQLGQGFCMHVHIPIVNSPIMRSYDRPKPASVSTKPAPHHVAAEQLYQNNCNDRL